MGGKRRVGWSVPRRPRLRVRRHNLDGSHSDVFVDMPITTQPDTPANPPQPDNPLVLDQPNTPEPQSQPTSKYRAAVERELACWEELRDPMLDTATQLAGPTSYVCSFCYCKEPFPLKCEDCGPSVVYCESCCVRIHITPCHQPEQWQGDHFKPFKLENLETTVLERTDHDCDNRSLRTFRVFDNSGRLRYWKIFLCGHEEDACTLLRFGLWPATAEKPQTAFSTSLLEWLTVLTLECQVSVLGFCNAVRWKSNLSTTEGNNLYKALIGQPMAEFHYYLHRKRTLQHLCPQVDNGTACPACPLDDSERIISLDANFGLVRKKSAGSSSGGTLHSELYFLPDAAATEFVDSYSQDSKPDEDCNNFQAGSSVRSKGRQEKLHVTGVFGAVCRHSMPVKFMDMHHGERLGYSVYMIQHLLTTIQPQRDLKVLVMYDIACILTTHLHNAGMDDMLGKIELAIPIFHCYGHKPSCQVLYSPRRMQGFGLSDGECVERLWSFLRKFSSITKEMTPSHRSDLLTDALLHYGRRKVTDMAISIAQSYDRAENAYRLANEELATLLDQSPVAVSEEDVEIWRKQEIETITQRNQQKQTSTVSKWKKLYVLLLSTFFSLRKDIQSCNSLAALVARCRELDQKLTEVERKHHINRWQEQDEEYKATLLVIDTEERRMLMEKLWREATERTFLLSLKRKYNDGQTIAKKISKQITSVNQKINKTIKKYSSIPRPPQDNMFPATIEFSNACQPTWQGYMQLDVLEEGAVPWSVKRQAIDAFCLKKRADEEVRMASREMHQFLETGKREHSVLAESLKSYKLVNNSGAVAMLTDRLASIERNLYHAKTLFARYLTDIPEVPMIMRPPDDDHSDKAYDDGNRNDDEDDEDPLMVMIESDIEDEEEDEYEDENHGTYDPWVDNDSAYGTIVSYDEE